jgi:uncharacterized membrane protein
MTNIDILKQANQIVSPKRLMAIAVTLIIMVISGLPQNIDPKFTALSLILSGPLGVGSAIFFLNLVRGHEVKVEQLFDGFRQFVPALILTVLTGILVFLGIICLIVPGIILGLGLTFGTYIMADDPDLSAMDVMRKSWDMTNGHKMKLFLFCLLCLGLAILGFLFFIIGIFYVIPIIYTGMAIFYEKLRDGTLDQPVQINQ